MSNNEAMIQVWVREQLQKTYGDKCVYIKYPAGQYSTRGVSDLIFCIHGLYVAIEVKTDTGKVTKLQRKFLEAVNIAGGISFVVYGKSVSMMENIKIAINCEL